MTETITIAAGVFFGLLFTAFFVMLMAGVGLLVDTIVYKVKEVRRGR